uniref:Uncharacterized protein n=1 Tax=Meloidogyne enterolobii TaxID=390850 RepID=A0A6V7UBP2_MELEN|nr:unnamed protein product [Meloidogyne enterolobii]
MLVKVRLNGITSQVQLSPNGKLTLQSLQTVHLDAFGLTYQTKDMSDPNSMELTTVVYYDEINKCFDAPDSGWNYTFDIVLRPTNVSVDSRPCTPSRSSSPFSEVQGPLPSLNGITKYLFYIPHDQQKFQRACVVCISTFYFVTFRHMIHKDYKEGQQISVFRDSDNVQFVTVVRTINEDKDFILLKSRTQIVDFGPSFCTDRCLAQSLLFSGYGTENERGRLTGLSHKMGNSHFFTNWTDVIDGKEKVCGPYMIGTINIIGGDSGGAVWDCHGFYGLNLGTFKFQLTDSTDNFNFNEQLQLKQNEKEMLSKIFTNIDRAANHLFTNYMLLATDILADLWVAEGLDKSFLIDKSEVQQCGISKENY